MHLFASKVRGVDALASFLEGPRARGAFVLRSILDPPWALRIQDEAPLTVVAVVRGRTWFVPDDGQPVALGAGDVAIIRGPAPYTVADHPVTRPTVVIHPGGHCTTLDGESLADAMGLGVRTWGTSTSGDDVMLTGTYQTDGEVSRWLLDALADLTVLRSGTWACPVIPLLAEEITRDEPGQEVVLDRLLDLLLVAALRASFAQPGVGAPAWYRAQSDPVVGRALKLMHNDPGHTWTVAALAAGAGVSRAALARRFHDLVGEPPMTFLTAWRMALAADLLLEPGASVGNVSRHVGYGSPFTFSTAFKRAYGLSPRAYRDRERSAARQAG
jgi:AraC-like DNA-binding protein